METEAAVGAIALSLAEHAGIYVAVWLFGAGIVAVLGYIFYGKGGKKRLAKQDEIIAEQGKKIAELEKRPTQAPVQMVRVESGGETTRAARQPDQGVIFHISEGLSDGPDGEKRVRVGTTAGPMTVRLNHEKTLSDVIRILRKNGILASLSDEYEMDRGREE